MAWATTDSGPPWTNAANGATTCWGFHETEDFELQGGGETC